jgi:hypothetical protein
MTALVSDEIRLVPLADATAGSRPVPKELLRTARTLLA